MATQLCLTLAVCLMISGFEAASLSCSVDSKGEVSSFKGENLAVVLPCHIRLAQFLAGDYKVHVNVANDKGSDTFSLSSVKLKVRNTKTKTSGVFRTSLNRLKKLSMEAKTDTAPWAIEANDLSELSLDYDFLQQAAIASLPNVLDLTFTADNVVLVVNGSSFIVSDPFPDSLCGDGLTADAVRSAAVAKFGSESESSVLAVSQYAVLTYKNIFTKDTCSDLRNKFWSCDKKEDAVKQCHPIFSEEGRAQCLAQSHTSLPDFYSACLTSVCDDDTTVLDAMKNHFKEFCPDYSENTTCSRYLFSEMLLGCPVQRHRELWVFPSVKTRGDLDLSAGLSPTILQQGM